MPPATATSAVPLTFGAPHPNGPTNSGTHAHVPSRPHHRHGHSADYQDPRVAQKAQHAHTRSSVQVLSKPLPSRPEQEREYISAPYQPTEAQRYKQQSLAKLTEREHRPSPASVSAGQKSSSLGRSATTDGRPSSASHPRRKPVTSQMNEEMSNNISNGHLATPTTDDPSGSSRSRFRQTAIYRDAPSQHQPETWSKATGQQRLDSRASSSKTVVQGHQYSKSGGAADHFVISSASLGRHHSASASVPSTTLPGSARTVQGVFPETPTASNPYPNQRYASNATTPQAVAFPVAVTPSKHQRHASTSSQDWSAERQRKLSHHRNASASTQDISPSSASTGSSHCDTWNSHTSQPDPPQQQQLPRRGRGMSDAPNPSTYYLGSAMSRPSQTSVVKLGGEEERGRKKDKDDSFMGRVRARSNSLTKSLSKAIQYPVYLVKGKKENRKSNVNLGQGGSTMLTGSDAGHSAHSQPYTPSTSTTSTHASPVSHRSRSHSVQARPKKLLSRREQEMRDEYHASPMTKAKNVVLNDWDGIDMPRRIDSVYAQAVKVAVVQTQYREGDTTPVYRARAPQVVPFMTEQPYPRRR
ncbi:SubName: Full=Uncharacterized protein {ECO:0000313/EMBL:CCA68079.1} [Serendipita indica DSM 11827]|nr:SubName: Full=Uncharacterized protein {ECO:0000313/EMBL:CCA68079.1} [Serendipita indica DSM 11827]